MIYALFIKRQWSDKDDHFWKFDGVVHTEYDRDQFVRRVKDEVKLTKDKRIRTIGFSIHELP